ncbi:hypothetical protein DXG01_013504 [Tephrocybe rancida]|nr:hypothetical protein DXG01_013504 [Tephrocybe rancida]
MRNLPERLDAAFQSVLDFNPRALRVQKQPLCPKLTHPLTFYDTHIDRRLSLKRVKSLPSFLTNLSQSVDIALAEATKDDNGLPSVDRAFPTSDQYAVLLDPAPARDAKDIGHIYLIRISLFACQLASMLLLHPNAATWATAIYLTRNVTSTRQKFYSLIDDYGLEISAPYQDIPGKTLPVIDKDAWDALSDLQRTYLRHIREKFPVVAVWQMFFAHLDAEDALKSLDRLAGMDSFPEILPLALVERWPPQNGPLSHSPDAVNTAWGTTVSSWVGVPESSTNTDIHEPPVTAATPPPGRTERSRVAEEATSTAQQDKKLSRKKKKEAPVPSRLTGMEQSWPEVTILARKRDMNVIDEDMAASVVQHAWTRAVKSDSSYIIFHCGTFERIAFRHRASQTLFVSDPIDVQRCRDPAYGHIQIGLYMSIVDDVRDRTVQIISQEANSKATKRKREAPIPESNKRPRTRATTTLEEARRLEYQRNFKLCPRTLALLRIQHGPYNSPAPSSFLRIDDGEASHKSTYRPGEYFRITITSEIAYGATGDAHRATIDLLGPDGRVVTFPDAVVKLAFNPVQRKRLRHEFVIYRRLMSTGARGIPYVFGLFEDVETQTLALVMENAGATVWECRLPDKSKRHELTISELEKAQFLDALKSIHDAGVRHRDLRIENLTINHDGDPYIIDFDRSALDADGDSRQREYEIFKQVLEGRYESCLSKETEESEVEPDDQWE